MAKSYLLPFFANWNVRRIDYAVDLWTPYANEYIKIFNRGMILKNFKQHEKYETSLYLTYSECNINFYNKLSDLKSKYDFQEVQKEYMQLGQIPTGIMRWEIQCKNKTRFKNRLYAK